MSRFIKSLDKALNVVTEAQNYSDESFIKLLKKSSAPAGEYGAALAKQPGQHVPIKALDDQSLVALITKVRGLVPEELKKYLPFYMMQVARGHLEVKTMESDRDRMAKTLMAFKQAARKASWTGSKNILDYKNWRDLEKQLIDVGAFNTDFSEQTKDSVVLHTQVYVDKNATIVAQLLGMKTSEPVTITYWFRKILTARGASKYGKGTQWCTNSDPDEDEHSPADRYIKTGLYIIEMRDSHGEPRHPIAQLSGDEFRGPEDQQISRCTPRLARFLRDVIAAAAHDIDEESLASLHNYSS